MDKFEKYHSVNIKPPENVGLLCVLSRKGTTLSEETHYMYMMYNGYEYKTTNDNPVPDGYRVEYWRLLQI